MCIPDWSQTISGRNLLTVLLLPISIAGPVPSLKQFTTMKHTIILLAGLFVFCSVPVQGQEFGIYGGLSFYEGELAPLEVSTYIETLRPAFGVFGRANVNDHIAFRLGFNRLTIMGDDDLRGTPQGQRSFETDMNELYLNLEITPFYLYLFNGGMTVGPYLYGGGAFFTFNPTRTWNGQRVELQPIGTEAQGQPGYPAPYDLQGFALIGGGGVKWLINEQWTLSAEYGARKTFTDHLDDLSSTPVVYGDVLQNGDLAAELSNPGLNPDTADLNYTYRRGGPNPDWYFTGGLTLSYLFGGGGGGGGKTVKCYEF